jgi:glycosyltransferase involved in cell wall biosynthesis
MPPPEPATTIVDCSGVGPGGITRVLTEVVRHWPAGYRLGLVAVPPAWEPPAERSGDVIVHSRQTGGRGRTIASATAALRRLTGRRARVLSLSPSLAIAGSRLPVTTVVHDLAFRLWPRGIPASVRQYRRASYATAIRRSAHLVCVSARTQHDLSGLYGVPAARTSVWRPGSDLDAGGGRLPAPLAEVRQRGQRYLVVTGHAAHKGVELAIDAVAGDPRFVLAVLTGGRRTPRFEEAAAASPASERILFLDRLSDEDYVAVVAGAAAFLMPSHFEGYGLPAAEALRLGVPTVISPDPALAEATDNRAIRMDSWTGAAVTRALARIDEPVPAGGPPRRSWRDATEELSAMVLAEPGAAAVRARTPGSGPG